MSHETPVRVEPTLARLSPSGFLSFGKECPGPGLKQREKLTGHDVGLVFGSLIRTELALIAFPRQRSHAFCRRFTRANFQQGLCRVRIQFANDRFDDLVQDGSRKCVVHEVSIPTKDARIKRDKT